MDEALDQIPDELRDSGLPIQIGHEYRLAWEKAAALSVLESLKGTKVAVAEVDVYVFEAWGPTETGASWIRPRWPGQTASEYADSSRYWAAQFISNHEGGDRTVYLLLFDDQLDAA